MSDDSDYIETNTTASDDTSDMESRTSSSKGSRISRSIIAEIDNYEDLEEEILYWIDEYVHWDPLLFSSPDFEETLIEDIAEFCHESWKVAGKSYSNYDDYEELVETLLENYYDFSDTPRRSEPYRELLQLTDPVINLKLQEKIAHLQSIPQPKQRTPEWYEFRNNLITASNLWKVFGSPATVNSLIYEKCNTTSGGDNADTRSQTVNTNSPMHWGVRYEPVTVMLYEKIFQTKVSDFGCIPHPRVSCVGASPDGINTDLTNPTLYGRMLEIKNIWNREITGIPKEEYWIQIQTQLETCDLDECDFVETRVKEYESEEAFYADEVSMLDKPRGVILYFVQSTEGVGSSDSRRITYDHNPVYKYMLLQDEPYDKTLVDNWTEEQRNLCREENLVLFQPIYWYLDEISCVLVKRNRTWFQAAEPQIRAVWNIITEERVSGYEHRLPRKRTKSNDIVVEVVDSGKGEASDCKSQQIRNLPKNTMVCLIKLDSDGNLLA
jgi:hypothetical protein